MNKLGNCDKNLMNSLSIKTEIDIKEEPLESHEEYLSENDTKFELVNHQNERNFAAKEGGITNEQTRRDILDSSSSISSKLGNGTPNIIELKKEKREKEEIKEFESPIMDDEKDARFLEEEFVEEFVEEFEFISDSELSFIGSEDGDEDVVVTTIEEDITFQEFLVEEGNKRQQDPLASDVDHPGPSHEVNKASHISESSHKTSQCLLMEVRDKQSPNILNKKTISSKNITAPLLSVPDETNITASNQRPVLWFSEKDNNYKNNIPVFLGTSQINFNGDTPYDFFMKMFPEKIFEIISTESIRYSVQVNKPHFNVSTQELKTYLGINIMMTYIKYPQSRMYWSSIAGLGVDFIANKMPVNRFEEIKRFLHFSNNEEKDELKKDNFWKIRPIANILHDTFHEAKTPEEYQSIDEIIVPFNGRSGLKQYIKSKPKKWGFKIWVKASSSGYVNCFELYQGKKGGGRSSFGPIGDRVLRLCHDIHGNNHKLFMDNLFTTLPLLRHLQAKNVHVVGTLRVSRAPKNAIEKLTDAKKLSRGMCSMVTSSDNITIVRWMDSNAVHTISSYAGVLPLDEVKRWDRSKKERITIARPFSIQQYNMFMGGVDLVDRMIAQYPHGFKNKKWYLRVFFYLLNLAVVNAWHLFKEKKGQPKLPLLTFKASVATSLIAVGTAAKKRGRPWMEEEPEVLNKRTARSNIPLVVRYDGDGHYPEKNDTKREQRCHDKHCKKKTRYKCKKCKEPVCPQCMENFHTK